MRLLLAWFDDWVGDDDAPVIVVPSVVVSSSPDRRLSVVDGGATSDISQLFAICDVVIMQPVSDVSTPVAPGRRFSTSPPRTLDVVENFSELFEGSHADVSDRDEMTLVVDGSNVAELVSP